MGDKRRALKPVNRALLGVLLLVLSLLPFVVSSREGIIDPFTHGKIAATILLLENGRVDLSTSNLQYTPGMGVLVAAITLLTSISPVQVEYLPVAGMLALGASFLLARKLGHDFLLAALVTILLSFRFFGISYYSVW